MKLHINASRPTFLATRIVVPYRAFHANCRQVTAAGPLDSICAAEFGRVTNSLLQPLVLYGPLRDSTTLPAIDKWFRGTGVDASFKEPYFSGVQDNIWMRYELTGAQPTAHGDDAISLFYRTLTASGNPMAPYLIQPTDTPCFSLFEAPLTLMMAASAFNSRMRSDGTTVGGLYISQNPLRSLPPTLLDDVPMPALVSNEGKVDIYSTSIWIGLEPTYTSLHSDPNPNLFIQLCGTKTLRLLPPRSGEALFQRVQTALGSWGSPRMRSTEMMTGPERDLFEKHIWRESREDMVEATVNPGDAFFIPRGWWHSVRSSSNDGRLNASVNWWFRWRADRRRAYIPPVRPKP